MTKSAAVLLLAYIAALYVIDANAGPGLAHAVWPRDVDRLPGAVTGAFLHADQAHLAGNIVGVGILGGIAATRGAAYLGAVLTAGVVAGGGLLWAIGDHGTPVIGASGVVFALLGAYIVATVLTFPNEYWISKSLSLLVCGAIAVSGLVPRDGVSWEGHLGGLIAGVICAAVYFAVKTIEENR